MGRDGTGSGNTGLLWLEGQVVEFEINIGWAQRLSFAQHAGRVYRNAQQYEFLLKRLKRFQGQIELFNCCFPVT